MSRKLYTIGELAQRSGVPTKTIRFYSDSGLLPPSDLTTAGYRLYNDADHSRLATIRALRGLGFSLPAIGDLLREQQSVTAAFAVHLATLDLQLQTLRRQRTLVQAALHQGEAGALAYLDHAHALASLAASERQAFIDGQLTKIFAGVPADPTWQAQFVGAATLDLPDELNDEQFAAWLELAALLANESFVQRFNQLGRDYWGRTQGDSTSTFTNQHQIYNTIIDTMQAGVAPADTAAQPLLDHYLQLQAPSVGLAADDPDLPAALLAQLAQGHDPRAARYWELLAILHGWEPSPMSTAHDWLVAGLRQRMGKPTRGGENNDDQLYTSATGISRPTTQCNHRNN